MYGEETTFVRHAHNFNFQKNNTKIYQPFTNFVHYFVFDFNIEFEIEKVIREIYQMKYSIHFLI